MIKNSINISALVKFFISIAKKMPRGKKPAHGDARTPPAENGALFERLHALRASLSHHAYVPPYVIFSNATLADMAARQPDSHAALLAVRGVGEAKARRYGDAFLEAIRAYRRGQA